MVHQGIRDVVCSVETDHGREESPSPKGTCRQRRHRRRCGRRGGVLRIWSKGGARIDALGVGKSDVCLDAIEGGYNRDLKGVLIFSL